MLSLGVQEVLFITISVIITITSIFLVNKYLIQSWFKNVIQFFLLLTLTFLVIISLIGIKNIIKVKYYSQVLQKDTPKSVI